MGRSALSTQFLKECIADALINLLAQKPADKITIQEITALAGVGRASYFRHFNSLEDVITFKLILLWNHWADTNELKERCQFSLDNALPFFEFNNSIRNLLQLIYKADMQAAIYDAFYKIMMPQHNTNTIECYENRFYSFGLFGILDEWIKREFHESPQEMITVIHDLLKPKDKV